MTGADKGALETLRTRIDHVGATARLLSTLGDLDSDVADAVAGIGHTLNEIASKLDATINPVGAP